MFILSPGERCTILDKAKNADNEMYCWESWDVDHRFEIKIRTILIPGVPLLWTYRTPKRRHQHLCSVTNIQKWSLALKVADDVTNITVIPSPRHRLKLSEIWTLAFLWGSNQNLKPDQQNYKKSRTDRSPDRPRTVRGSLIGTNQYRESYPDVPSAKLWYLFICIFRIFQQVANNV